MKMDFKENTKQILQTMVQQTQKVLLMDKAVLQSMTLSKKKVMDFTNVTNLQRGNMLRRNIKAIRHF